MLLIYGGIPGFPALIIPASFYCSRITLPVNTSTSVLINTCMQDSYTGDKFTPEAAALLPEQHLS